MDGTAFLIPPNADGSQRQPGLTRRAAVPLKARGAPVVTTPEVQNNYARHMAHEQDFPVGKDWKSQRMGEGVLFLPLL